MEKEMEQKGEGSQEEKKNRQFEKLYAICV